GRGSACAWALRKTAGPSAWRTTARVSRRACAIASSNPSSPPNHRAKEPAWGYTRSTVSCAKPAEGSSSRTRPPAARGRSRAFLEVRWSEREDAHPGGRRRSGVSPGDDQGALPLGVRDRRGLLRHRGDPE